MLEKFDILFINKKLRTHDEVSVDHAHCCLTLSFRSHLRKMSCIGLSTVYGTLIGILWYIRNVFLNLLRTLVSMVNIFSKNIYKNKINIFYQGQPISYFP